MSNHRYLQHALLLPIDAARYLAATSSLQATGLSGYQSIAAGTHRRGCDASVAGMSFAFSVSFIPFFF
jgi:hypothetical protein